MLNSNSYFLKKSQSKYLNSPRNDSLSMQRKNSSENNEKSINISQVKKKNDLHESINSIKQDQVEIDLEINEYKQKYMSLEEQSKQPTSIKVIEVESSPVNIKTPPLKLLQTIDQEFNTSTIKSTFVNQNSNSPKTPFTRTSKNARNLSLHQQQSFQTANSPHSPPNLLSTYSPKQQTIGPYDRYSQTLFPPPLEGLQNYQRHLKKHDTLRTFGTMFKQVQMVRLKPQMSERKQTYHTFHQNNYKKSIGEMDYKGKSVNVTQRNQKNKQKKGVMYTNELWSDSYYQKIFKTSMLDEIEQQINIEKMHQTAKETQKNLNQFFDSLFESKQDLNKFEGMFSKRRISLNQNEILSNYITNQINTTNALVSQRSIQHSSGNIEQHEQLFGNQMSQSSTNSIKLNKNITNEQIPSLPYQASNQNILQAMIKKSAFSQNNQVYQENYLQTDQVESHTNSLSNDYLVPGQHISTSQVSLNEDEKSYSNNKPYFPQQQIFTMFNQEVKQNSFKQPKNKPVKRECNYSLTCRHNQQKSISLHMNQKFSKGFETSRNVSPELSTRASPFFLSQKTTRMNSIQNIALNMEKQGNHMKLIEKNKNQQQIKQTQQQNLHRRTFSDNLQQKQRCLTFFDQIQANNLNQYKTEIGQILQECRFIQNDNLLLKDKIKEQMRVPHIQMQISKDFDISQKKKEYLIALNTKQVDTREAIDQRRKYMNSFNFLRAKDPDEVYS